MRFDSLSSVGRHALRNKRLVRPAPVRVLGWHLAQHVALVEVARGPADVAQEHYAKLLAPGPHHCSIRPTVRVRLLERDLLAHERLARRDVPAARLGVERLPAVAAQPLRERRPRVVDVVRRALRVRTPTKYDQFTYINRCITWGDVRVVEIEVLVHVEDQVGDAAVGVCDLVERVGRAVGHEGLRRRPVVTREQDQLRSRASTHVGGLRLSKG